jgi:hypothetical protein
MNKDPSWILGKGHLEFYAGVSVEFGIPTMKK